MECDVSGERRLILLWTQQQIVTLLFGLDYCRRKVITYIDSFGWRNLRERFCFSPNGREILINLRDNLVSKITIYFGGHPVRRLYLKRTITEIPWFLLYCLSPDKELSQLQGSRIVALEDLGWIWVRDDVVIFIKLRRTLSRTVRRTVRRTLRVGRNDRLARRQPIKRHQTVRKPVRRTVRRTVRGTLQR